MTAVTFQRDKESDAAAAGMLQCQLRLTADFLLRVLSDAGPSSNSFQFIAPTSCILGPLGRGPGEGGGAKAPNKPVFSTEFLGFFLVYWKALENKGCSSAFIHALRSLTH